MNIDDYKKRTCLTTPQDYFEQLNAGIKEATCKNIAIYSKRKPLAQKIASIMSYAAMIAIVISIATGIIIKRHNNSSSATATNIAEEREFIDNILTNYPIDEYTFYSYLTGNE